MRGRRARYAALGFVALLGACSSSSSASKSSESSGHSDAATATTITHTAGPTATIVKELSGGKGVNVAAPAPPESVLTAAGYEQHEYEADGTATSYKSAAFPADGRWTFTPDATAPYKTRIVVRRPTDGTRFSGTVAVEWMNVSGGLDADPDWQTLHEELTREGDIWVGVSTQLIGINGGPIAVTTPQSEAAGAGKGIRNIDPERYGSLDLPGDGYSFDIFTQIERALRAGGQALGGATPDRVYALGESQSAFAMVTYVNGVQPLTQAFDGFFVHSRGGPGLPLAAPGQPVGIADSLSAPPTILRTDTTVPIIDVQTESDVTGLLASVAARQDDSDRFRLWEVAGTAHADRRIVGANADALGCGPINNAPLHLVAKAAFHDLDAWSRTDAPPPTAPRLQLVDGAATPTQARDANGIALGGIRVSPVDVPVDVLSGVPDPSATAVVCILSGSTTPLSAEVLAARYPSKADYQQQYATATDKTIAAGYLLDADRDAMQAYSQPDRIAG